MKRKKKRTSFKSKNILIIMTILCVGMIVYGLSAYARLEGLHSAAGYLVTPFQKGMSTVPSGTAFRPGCRVFGVR